MSDEYADEEARVRGALPTLFPTAPANDLTSPATAAPSSGRFGRHRVFAASVAVAAVVAVSAVTTWLVSQNRSNSQPGNEPSPTATSEPPAWAVSCLNTDGPINHEYDGLDTDAALKRAAQLKQSLILAASDGRCTQFVAKYVPGEVEVALSGGVVVYARGPN